MGRKAIDVTGNKYGNLTVIKKSHSAKGNLYWECVCECGELCYVISSDLKRGRTNYCERCNDEKSHISILNDLYVRYKRGSLRREYEFELTLNEFKTITSQNCTYCGIEPRQIHYKKGMRYKLIYNGIDRQNNDIGYVLNNSVPCCKFCNLAKSRFDLTEFKEWLEIIKNK